MSGTADDDDAHSPNVTLLYNNQLNYGQYETKYAQYEGYPTDAIHPEPGPGTGHPGSRCAVQRSRLPGRVDHAARHRQKQRVPFGEHPEAARISSLSDGSERLHSRTLHLAPVASLRLEQDAHSALA